MRALGPLNDIGAERWGFTFQGMNPFHNDKTGDVRFLAEHAAVLKVEKQKLVSYTSRRRP